MLCSRLTVEFSPPWWVGTLERWEDSRYEVGRVVFGAEPTEPEVLLWVLHQLPRAAHHPGRRGFGPPAGGTEPQAAAAPDRPGAAAPGRKEGLGRGGAAGREAEKQTRRQQTARERRDVAREKYRLHRKKQQQKHRGH